MSFSLFRTRDNISRGRSISSPKGYFFKIRWEEEIQSQWLDTLFGTAGKKRKTQRRAQHKNKKSWKKKVLEPWAWEEVSCLYFSLSSLFLSGKKIHEAWGLSVGHKKLPHKTRQGIFSLILDSLSLFPLETSLSLSFFTLCVHRRQTGRRVETWQETFPKDTAVIEKRKLREEQSLFDPYSGISPKTQL